SQVRLGEAMNNMTNRQPVVQRTITLEDKGAIAQEEQLEEPAETPGLGEQSLKHLSAVLDQPQYAAWAAGLAGSENVHLKIVVEPEQEEPPQHAKTTVTNIEPPMPSSAPWSTVLKQATKVTLTVTLYPSYDDGAGELMSFLMHELTLHVQP